MGGDGAGDTAKMSDVYEGGQVFRRGGDRLRPNLVAYRIRGEPHVAR